MENEETVITQSESNGVPKIIIAICLVNIFYLGYLILVTTALLPLFESKSLLYFSIFTSIVGIISNIGLLSMKKWALYAYTITCIVNFYTSAAMGNLSPFSIIICVVGLLVIWSNKDKILGYSEQFGEELNETNLEEHNEIVDNEINVSSPIENTESLFEKPVYTKSNEIKANDLPNIIGDWKLIKEWLYTNRNKLVIPVLCLWSFMHTYLIVKSNQVEYIEYQGLKLTLDGEIFSTSSKFYPFTSSGGYSWFDVRYYDFTEYFVYVGGAWLIYFLYRYLKGSK